MRKCFWQKKSFPPSRSPQQNKLLGFIHITKLSRKEGMTRKNTSRSKKHHFMTNKACLSEHMNRSWREIMKLPTVNNENQKEFLAGGYEYCNVNRIITYTLEIFDTFRSPPKCFWYFLCGLYAWNEWNDSFNGDAKFSLRMRIFAQISS
jgi:hypothetical protein